jgi:hypothetical protein
MPRYTAPTDDMLFLLREVLGYEALGNLPGFSDAPLDTVEVILGEAGRLASEVFQPLNRTGDVQGCTRHADGRVTTPDGFREAYRTFAEGGWIGLSVDPAYGGQGLPYVVTCAVSEFMASANMALGAYGGLTMGAAAALYTHGSEALKSTYLPRMATGEWTGTMNLTEPHCGTDLGLIRTKAVPAGDGSYAITGTKIFISGGEHDLTDNIVHLVLARIEGAPAGTKGISLFLVPKRLPREDGSPGTDNGVSCGSIEHKMGLHGSSTCVLNYDGAKGWLVGEENRGLPAMFVMMNEARLVVGIQGLSQSEVALQNAADYARDRLQGRSLTGAKAPDKPADPIIVHPDVRRTLLGIRAFNQAARGLMLGAAMASDIVHRSPDAAARQAAEDRLGLLTPVIKGVLTDWGFDNTVRAQQMLGGHGYIAEWGLEQFVRDARITQIYEGANGIQALDLVGRKLPKDGGRAAMAFFGEVAGFVKEAGEDPAMEPFVKPLGKGLGDLQQGTMWFMQNAMAKPDNAGAGATDYMHLFGLVALGHVSAQIARAALRDPDAPGNKARLAAARYFAERELPGTGLRLARITAGADTVMSLSADLF